jgi:hypothetical protein
MCAHGQSEAPANNTANNSKNDLATPLQRLVSTGRSFFELFADTVDGPGATMNDEFGNWSQLDQCVARAVQLG